MSMNIMIIAERKITFKKKNGKRTDDIQNMVFEAYQTPTRITYEIVEKGIQVYIDWVLAECSRDEVWPIYAEDDLFGEREPIGFETINDGKEHIAKLQEWLKKVEEDGFTLKFDVI